MLYVFSAWALVSWFVFRLYPGLFAGAFCRCFARWPSGWAQAVSTPGNGSYSLQNSGSTTVHIQLNDQVGFMKDTVNVGTKAALINTSITPLSSNPGGYKDTTNQMIEQRWRLLEPQ